MDDSVSMHTEYISNRRIAHSKYSNNDIMRLMVGKGARCT